MIESVNICVYMLLTYGMMVNTNFVISMKAQFDMGYINIILIILLVIFNLSFITHGMIVELMEKQRKKKKIHKPNKLNDIDEAILSLEKEMEEIKEQYSVIKSKRVALGKNPNIKT